MRGGCIPGLTGKDSRNHRNIKRLDWSRQWDIALLSGERYINMIITDVDEQCVFAYNMDIPGYEELGGERAWYIPLSNIKSITESPDRDACLCPMADPLDGKYHGCLWRMMYLSPSEKERYGAIFVDDLWSLMSADGVRSVRVYGVDATLRIFLDPLGRIHIIHSDISFGAKTYCILEDTYEKPRV